MKWSYRFKVYKDYKGKNQQQVGNFLLTIPQILKHSEYNDGDTSIPWSVTKSLTLTKSDTKESKIGLYEYVLNNFKNEIKDYISDIEYSGFTSANISTTIGFDGSSSKYFSSNFFTAGTNFKEIFFNKGDYFSSYYGSGSSAMTYYFVNDSGYYFKAESRNSSNFCFYDKDDNLLGQSFLGIMATTRATIQTYKQNGVFSILCCDDAPGVGNFTDFTINYTSDVSNYTLATNMSGSIKFNFITDLLTKEVNDDNYSFYEMSKVDINNDVLNYFFSNCPVVSSTIVNSKKTLEEEMIVDKGTEKEAKWTLKIPVVDKNVNNYTEITDNRGYCYDYGISYPITGIGSNAIRYSKSDYTDLALLKSKILDDFKFINFNDLSIIYYKPLYDENEEYRLMVDLCGNKLALEDTNTHTLHSNSGNYFKVTAKTTGQLTLNWYDKEGMLLGNDVYSDAPTATASYVDQQFLPFSSISNSYTLKNFALPIVNYTNSKGGYNPIINNSSCIMLRITSNYIAVGVGCYNLYTESAADIFVTLDKTQLRTAQCNNSFSYWLSLLEATAEEKEPDNPYEGGGSSTTGGGGGTYDDSSDIIESGGGSQIGGVSEFITTFLPTPTQISQISSYLYSEDLLNILAKFLNNFFTGDIFNYILDLHVIPFKLSPTGTGEITLPWGIHVPVPDIEYTDKYIHHWWSDEMTVEEYYGSALDYSPYTDIKIYLPFCGEFKLDPNDVIKKKVQIHYAVDILTGTCSAEILSEGSVRYTFTGNMGFTIPLQNTSFDNLITNLMGAVASFAIPTSTEAVSRALPLLDQSTADAARADWMGQNRKRNAVNSVLDNIKPSVTRTGNLNANNGWLGPTKPYFIISRPIQDLPENYNKFFGYPSNIYSKLGDLTGYTEVSDIHLEGFSATVEEIKEIEALLNGGVIL